jgi:hypothetical protein
VKGTLLALRSFTRIVEAGPLAKMAGQFNLPVRA